MIKTLQLPSSKVSYVRILDQIRTLGCEKFLVPFKIIKKTKKKNWNIHATTVLNKIDFMFLYIKKIMIADTWNVKKIFMLGSII